jgi:hypothetical protein
MGPEPIQAMVLGYTERAKEGDIASALGSTPQDFRLKCVLSRVV